MSKQKTYSGPEYIDDVFDMCKMQTWDERLQRATKICDGLRDAMTLWQLRWIERAMLGVVAFGLGMILGSFG